MNELAIFAGAGGGILGSHLLGWRTVCAVEFAAWPASVLAQRQNDGFLPAFPIWDDVRTFDGRCWRGIVDVVSGGFPCQDISLAGGGKGIDGERSGLWAEMARIIDEVRPRFAFVENSPALTSRGLGRILGDLAEMGFYARWGVLGAADVGAPHRRERIWIVAHANGMREPQQKGRKHDQRGRVGNGGKDMADTYREPWHEGRACDAAQEPGRRDINRSRQPTALCHTPCTGLAQRKGKPGDNGEELAAIIGSNWWAVEPELGRVADGVAARVDRLKAIGNGQVPQCAAEAWRLLTANVELRGASDDDR